MSIKRYIWAVSMGNVAHKIYSKNYRVEGESTACGRRTQVGWTWISGSILKRYGARRCTQCQR
jgi:hypothetical protein